MNWGANCVPQVQRVKDDDVNSLSISDNMNSDLNLGELYKFSPCELLLSVHSSTLYG